MAIQAWKGVWQSLADADTDDRNSEENGFNADALLGYLCHIRNHLSETGLGEDHHEEMSFLNQARTTSNSSFYMKSARSRDEQERSYLCFPLAEYGIRCQPARC